ncbi:DUF3000 domain-containing protein [Neomicrococcus aestuarii]|nr:DUF3000 domain-containing protein [Neomicrococcus aestuarii]APF41616.1 enoyl-CoA hydratase [Neomicrococcus aestuarii]
MSGVSPAPSAFRSALRSLKSAQCRPEIVLSEIPAPARLAPFSVALAADLFEAPLPAHTHESFAHGQDRPDILPQELATGRFILLHDPAGSPVWGGHFRVVTYIRARLEPEMGQDAMLGSVAWAWLVEALEENNASYSRAGGTATRVLSENFGSLADREDNIDIELRASWTPNSDDFGRHLEAWTHMVCSFGGLPPLPEGVTALPRRRLN